MCVFCAVQPALSLSLCLMHSNSSRRFDRLSVRSLASRRRRRLLPLPASDARLMLPEQQFRCLSVVVVVSSCVKNRHEDRYNERKADEMSGQGNRGPDTHTHTHSESSSEKRMEESSRRREKKRSMPYPPDPRLHSLTAADDCSHRDFLPVIRLRVLVSRTRHTQRGKQAYDPSLARSVCETGIRRPAICTQSGALVT